MFNLIIYIKLNNARITYLLVFFFSTQRQCKKKKQNLPDERQIIFRLKKKTILNEVFLLAKIH